MKLDELDLTKAPKSGYILAYSEKKVIFRDYDDLDEIDALLDGSELLEIHLFDDFREYRAITSRSPRFTDGKIEHVSEFPEEGDNVFSEEIQINKNFENFDRNNKKIDGNVPIQVLNHIGESNGQAFIDDYRLKIGGKSNG